MSLERIYYANADSRSSSSQEPPCLQCWGLLPGHWTRFILDSAPCLSPPKQNSTDKEYRFMCEVQGRVGPMMEEASRCSQPPKADRRSGYDCLVGERGSSCDFLARRSTLKLRCFIQSSERHDRKGESAVELLRTFARCREIL